MSVVPPAEGGHSQPPGPQPNPIPPRPPSHAKRWYINERIVVTDPEFQNDHARFSSAPGFHIFGLCPSCGHQTSSVCATEYLAQDVDPPPVDAGTARAEAAAPAHVPWEGDVKEVRRLQGELPATRRTSLPAEPWERLWRYLTTTRPAPGEPTGDGAGEPKEAEPAEKTMLTVMRCACTFNHVAHSGVPSPPAGAFGCGSEWVVRVRYSDEQAEAEILPVGELEAAYCWPAADAAAAQVPNALTNARASAKNWGAGLTAILTLGGVGALLTNESTVRSLNTFWQVMFGIAAFISVIANGVMLYQSTIASYGSARSAEALRPSDLRDADLDLLVQARATLRKLRVAVRATVVAVVAALFAAGILLYGATTPAPATPPTGSVLTQTQP